VTFNFGDVTNAGNNDGPGGADEIELEVVLEVPADQAGNVRGATMGVSVLVEYDSDTLTAALNNTVVEAALAYSRTLTRRAAVVDAADTFDLEATVSHVAVTSGAPAFDIVLEDDAGTHLTPSTGSVVCAPAICGAPSAVGSVLTVPVAELPLGTSLTVSWQAIVD
jgi:hypothetical protein